MDKPKYPRDICRQLLCVDPGAETDFFAMEHSKIFWNYYIWEPTSKSGLWGKL